MSQPMVERPRSRRLQGLGLAAGFAGAGLLWIGGQVPIVSVVVPIAVVLLGAFIVAMGRAARR